MWQFGLIERKRQEVAGEEGEEMGEEAHEYLQLLKRPKVEQPL